MLKPYYRRDEVTSGRLRSNCTNGVVPGERVPPALPRRIPNLRTSTPDRQPITLNHGHRLQHPDP
ncbi:MAG: hypothetical protein ACYSWU_14250, partial [Planctomycetota bacterium]